MSNWTCRYCKKKKERSECTTDYRIPRGVHLTCKECMMEIRRLNKNIRREEQKIYEPSRRINV